MDSIMETEPLPETEPLDGALVDPAAEIDRLLGLDDVGYALQRKALAKAMDMGMGILDKLVKDRRKELNPDNDGKQGRPVQVHIHEPWPSPVNGAELLRSIVTQIRRYVVLSEDEAIAIALWVVHTHCFDLFPITPRLHISSPQKGCGKSTLLLVIELMLKHFKKLDGITASTLFRIIEIAEPSFCLDEADTFINDNEMLRGMLNAGYAKGGTIVRAVGDDHEPREFSVSCPVAIAGIGNIPETLESRSIPIRMQRRLNNEPVERLRPDKRDHFEEIGRYATRWVADNKLAIGACDPHLPDALQDRPQDNWRPLVTIADVAGGEWPSLARRAAVVLSGKASDEDQSIAVMLLADVMEVFEDLQKDRLRGSQIVDALVEREDRPWPEWKHGKPMTQTSLARLVKPFGIKSTLLRFDYGPARGYERVDFQAAFDRYVSQQNLPNSLDTPFQSVTGVTALINNDISAKQSVTLDDDVTLSNSEQSNENNAVTPVTLSNPPNGTEGEL